MCCVRVCACVNQAQGLGVSSPIQSSNLHQTFAEGSDDDPLLLTHASTNQQDRTLDRAHSSGSNNGNGNDSPRSVEGDAAVVWEPSEDKFRGLVRKDLELSDDAWRVLDEMQTRADRLRRQVKKWKKMKREEEKRVVCSRGGVGPFFL